MAPNIIDLVNQYYEAKKPYTQLLRESRATPSSQNSSPEPNASTTSTESSDTVPSQQEPQFSSLTPRIPPEEITEVIKKLQEAKIEYAQADRSTTSKASAGKKGKAPAEKK